MYAPVLSYVYHCRAQCPIVMHSSSPTSILGCGRPSRSDILGSRVWRWLSHLSSLSTRTHCMPSHYVCHYVYPACACVPPSWDSSIPSFVLRWCQMPLHLSPQILQILRSSDPQILRSPDPQIQVVGSFSSPASCCAAHVLHHCIRSVLHGPSLRA